MLRTSLRSCVESAYALARSGLLRGTCVPRAPYACATRTMLVKYNEIFNKINRQLQVIHRKIISARYPFYNPTLKKVTHAIKKTSSHRFNRTSLTNIVNPSSILRNRASVATPSFCLANIVISSAAHATPFPTPPTPPHASTQTKSDAQKSSASTPTPSPPSPTQFHTPEPSP